ncbi:MAG: transcription termination factor NusA [Ruminococcus sp.]|jgi:N utilization substance protein A|nr:transcription termination factor NusA [Ruminococcus sp.]
MNNKELFAALAQMEKEKGIPVDYMLEQIERAIKVACKNNYGGNENVVFKVNPEKGTFDVKLVKTVVEEVEDPNFEISLEEVRKKRKRIDIGDEYEVALDPKQLGRIAVQTARSVIRQGIRDGEKGQMRKEFESRLGELVTATVERVDPTNGMATIKIGKAIATLPKSEQIGDRELREGDKIKVLVADIKDNERGPRAMISRTSPELVKRLFEQEVPEIFDGQVEIKAIAREAGSRTKMAVLSNDENIDAIGSCIGTRGDRVNRIVDELGNEKIDIIEYSEDPIAYVAAALSPATVLKVEILDESQKSCKVTVPDGQLSLAIGNKGQNARLAARLTGWKIDIRPESGFYGEDEDDEAEEESAE